MQAAVEHGHIPNHFSVPIFGTLTRMGQHGSFPGFSFSVPIIGTTKGTSIFRSKLVWIAPIDLLFHSSGKVSIYLAYCCSTFIRITEMEEITDPELVENTAPDEHHAFVDCDGGVIDPRLYASDDLNTRQQYFEAALDSSEKTKWKHEKNTFCSRIEVNGASNRLLQSCKNAVAPTVKMCRRLSQFQGGNDERMAEKDFANIWLNRNFYIIFQDYINARIADPGKHAQLCEVVEIFRVWILQMIHGETARTLFQEPEWYAKSRMLKISLERYLFLFEALGAGLPVVDTTVHDDDPEGEDTAIIWGSFHQYNPIISQIEQEFGIVGMNFIIEGNCTAAIDDDKI